VPLCEARNGINATSNTSPHVVDSATIATPVLTSRMAHPPNLELSQRVDHETGARHPQHPCENRGRGR
jgi:hypothetical protein